MTAPTSSQAAVSLLSPLQPPSLARSWLTAPHPTLPILATCSSDKTVRIYSLTSFTLLSKVEGGHKRSVRCCAWKPGVKGESVLATGSFDASVGIWRHWDQTIGGVGSGTHDVGDEMDYTNGNGGGDGDGKDEEDDSEWRFAIVLDGHDSEVKSVAWSTGGNFLATCSRDKSVWIWEEVGDEDFETIAVLQEHEGDVKCVVWHPEEELLASASYDDTIRLWREDVDDWGCVACIKGHDSTVWALEWEPTKVMMVAETEETTEQQHQKEWIKRRNLAGPRLVSCSDDMTIRVWRRRPRGKGPQQNKLSIIRTGSIEEDWVEEARLPQRHERAIYSVAWSKRTGRIVSSGGDGKIVVYEERWRSRDPARGATPPSKGEASDNNQSVESEELKPVEEATEWVVLAELEGAHSVFEINHVSWARRADRGKRSDDEEIIVSSGDDGVVKTWTLDV
ncbi:WD40/YVTN repeat-like-containing domain [Lasallia pustulata]|uniref:Probable cytosolic iron-sulfur protein assembly protein 1 n=1 Tax=Lasallia pustulata TaxID=136370 RepID=A0A1W5CX40_9LECA|nr:WD40/YVTN repeat-like-containing domain [Lasallia pustulata]